MKELAKKVLFRYTPLGKPRYPFGLDTRQIHAIVESLEATSQMRGAICELGVASGATSIFIAKWMSETSCEDRFYCIDTFESFTEEDLKYEASNRGKNVSEMKYFEYNDYERWKKNFESFDFLEAVKSDVKDFNFSRIAPVKFMVLDVDLYLPTKSVLNRSAEFMAEGGIILVDDYLDCNKWDGSFQAVNEYVAECGRKMRVVGTKGVLLFY